MTRPELWRPSSVAHMGKGAPASSPPPCSAFGGIALSLELSHGDHWRTLGHPGLETTVDMRNVTHAHLLQGLGRQCTAPTRTTVQDILFAFVREDGLVIGRLRVDPKLQHAAWRVQGSHRRSFGIQLP